MIYFETSAKSGSNVERAFFKMTEDMSQRDFEEMENNDDHSYFDANTNQEEGGCC